MGVLSKLVTDPSEPEASWVALLPKALRQIHDVPGESGLSPDEIVFGRPRPLQGVPYRPPREAEGALEFLARMKAQDEEVAKLLNASHTVRWTNINLKRRDPPPFEVGAIVWYRPEPQPGTDKLAPRWKRGVVVERVGRQSYRVEISPGVVQDAHRSQLKPHVENEYSGQPLPCTISARKQDRLRWSPMRGSSRPIEAHRTGPKGPEFLVHWKDWDPTDLTWEPWSHFFPGYNEDFVQYCAREGISLDVARLLGTASRGGRGAPRA